MPNALITVPQHYGVVMYINQYNLCNVLSAKYCTCGRRPLLYTYKVS